jgi:DedD protein
MEVRVRERLIGALVLVAIVVLLVPAVLKGPDRAPETAPGPETRSVEVVLDDSDRPPRDEILVPEPSAEKAPAPPADQPAAPESTVPAAAKSDAAALPHPSVAIRPPQTPPAAGTAAETPAWAVQLGAFSTREKADGLVADLRKRGYSAFVLEYRASGKVLHRVRVGPEQDRERAVAIAARLRKDGFQPVVAPHP